jgi:type VI protein secretion system component Hcp
MPASRHGHPRALPLILALLALGLCLPAARLQAALEGFLKVNSLNSYNAQYPDPLLTTWSPMLAFSIQSSSLSGSAAPGTLTVTKATDGTTPELMYMLARGTAVTTANFFIRNAGQPTPIYAINLKNGFVNGLSQSCDPTNGPTDEVRLIFQTVEVSVSTVDPQTAGVTSTTSAWNFSTAAEVTQAPPTLSLGATTVTTPEDTPAAVSLTLGDDFSGVASLTLTAVSSNPAVVANSGLAFSGTTAARTLTISPVANASGSTTVTVSVRDNSGLVTTADIAVTVTPVNDPPVVASVGAQVAWAGFPVTIPITLSDIDSPANVLTLTATSDNATVLPASGIALSGAGTAWSLTLTPSAAGNCTVTLLATDESANSIPVTFTLPVNAAGTGVPTDITLSANTVPENSAAGTLVGNLGVADPDNLSGHTYQLLDDAGGRFRLRSGGSPALEVAAGPVLDYETLPAPQVTIQVTDPDGHSFAKSFTLSVTNVNEAPVVAIGTLPSASSGTALPLTPVTLADPDSGTAAVRTTFSVLHGVIDVDTTGQLAGLVTGNHSATVVVTAPLAAINSVLAVGGVSYTATPGFTGDELLQVDCNDLGNTSPGGALSDTRVAAIAVDFGSYANWQAAVFSPAELADPNQSGATVVRGHDGLTNLVKYALGLDPHTDVTSAAPVFSQNGTDWVFTYTRPSSRPDLTYAVEVSTDLVNWTTAGVTHEQVSVDTAAHKETWRGRYPVASAGNVFVRLRVTLN